MNEEKMMILRMLKEGKISEEEAAKLLDAIENKNETNNNSKSNFKSKHNKDWEKEFEEKINKLESSFNKFGEKFEEKFEKFGKDFSEGTGSFADKIMSTFNSFMDKDNLYNILGRYEIKEENIQLEINDIESPVLDIRSINGDININPWSKNYIYVEATCYLKKNKISTENKIMSLNKSDNNIILKPLFDSDIAVKLDISLPHMKYENIKINTTNGKIDILDLYSKNISAFTKNASISLSDINCDYSVDLSTKNSPIYLHDTKCNEATLSTKNAKVIVNDGEINTLNINTSNSYIRIEDSNLINVIGKTSNGKIHLNNIDTDSIKTIRFITSNAGIYIDLDEFENPYKIDANTTNSNIDLNLSNIVYDYNNKNQNIKAHKEGSIDNPVIFDLNTTNGKININ